MSLSIYGSCLSDSIEMFTLYPQIKLLLMGSQDTLADNPETIIVVLVTDSTAINKNSEHIKTLIVCECMCLTSYILSH